MNKETKDFVKGIILARTNYLPESNQDWLKDAALKDNAYLIMSELCEALDIYSEVEEGEWVDRTKDISFRHLQYESSNLGLFKGRPPIRRERLILSDFQLSSFVLFAKIESYLLYSELLAEGVLFFPDNTLEYANTYGLPAYIYERKTTHGYKYLIVTNYLRQENYSD